MKKTFLLLTALCFLAFTNKAVGQTVNFGNIGDKGAPVTAELIDGILTISGNGNMADFDVSLNGVPWYSYRADIKIVIIENGVTNIGNIAFQDCSNLQKITIPEGVTIIGKQAFENCSSLSALSIPSSVATIEDGAFTNCTGLTAIADMATAPQNINPNVFQGVTMSGIYLAVPVKSIETYKSADVWSGFNVKAPYFILNNNLTDNIGDIVIGLDGTEYFYEYQNGNSNIPQRVTIIDGVNNTVKMIVNYNDQGLPAKITTNGKVILLDGYNGDNFSACVTYANGETHEYNNLSASGLSLYTNGNSPTISGIERANIELGMAGCILSGFEGDLDAIGCGSTLNEITETYLGFSIMTPQLVSQLGIISNIMTIVTCTSVLFGDLAGIPSCLIGGAQIIIGLFNGNNENNGLFSNGCNNVSWSLNAGTLVISGDDAFSCYPYPWADRANEITKLDIRNGVMTIPSSAFSGYNFTSVTIEYGAEPLTFGNTCTAGETTFLNSSIGSLYLNRNIVYGHDYICTISPFENNTSLTSLTIGANVTSIENGCFSGCSGLISISFDSGSSLTSIGDYAFSDCTNLKNIANPSSLISIGNSAFSGCINLTSANIGSGVTSIGGDAFQGTGLKNITIPGNITSVGYTAFSNCSNLTSVTIEYGAEPLTFGNTCTAGETTFLNSSIGSLYLNRNIVYGHDYICTISPFENNTSLTSLSIGTNVTSIEAGCFSNCTSLTQITSNPTTPPTIYENTFYGVDRSIPVNVPCNSICDYKDKEFWKLFTNYQSTTDCASPCITGIEEVTVQNFQIYPNPAHSELFIKSTLPINKVEIYSLTGALMHIENNINGKISVSDLPKGVYMVKVYTDNGLAIEKVVKE